MPEFVECNAAKVFGCSVRARINIPAAVAVENNIGLAHVVKTQGSWCGERERYCEHIFAKCITTYAAAEVGTVFTVPVPRWKAAAPRTRTVACARINRRGIDIKRKVGLGGPLRHGIHKC